MQQLNPKATIRTVVPKFHATQYDGTRQGALAIAEWASSGKLVYDMGTGLFENVADTGVEIIEEGDWVVRAASGEFTVVTDQAFAADYQDAPATNRH